MKILYSHRTRSRDGQRIHIDALTEALTGAGHEVLVSGPEGVVRVGHPPPRATETSDARQLPGRPGGMLGAVRDLAEFGYGARSVPQLLRTARQFGPDIIYERYNLFHHAGSIVAAQMGLPLILEVNAPLVEERARTDMLSLRRFGRWSEDRIWRAADAVLPVSTVLRDMIARRGVAEDRLHVIPNGVHGPMLEPGNPSPVLDRYGIDPGSLVIGFTGFVREWHRTDLVLEWMRRPVGSKAHFLLVGDGPAVPSLETQARTLGVSERLHVTGVVPADAVRDHVAAFDIALQPAVTAYASPLKLQEYMAQGKAVVAPNQANIAETVVHEESAILVAPDTPEAFAAALDRLATDPELRRRIGQNARRTLEARNMTWEGNADRVAKIARDLVAKRSG